MSQKEVTGKCPVCNTLLRIKREVSKLVICPVCTKKVSKPDLSKIIPKEKIKYHVCIKGKVVKGFQGLPICSEKCNQRSRKYSYCELKPHDQVKPLSVNKIISEENSIKTVVSAD